MSIKWGQNRAYLGLFCQLAHASQISFPLIPLSLSLSSSAAYSMGRYAPVVFVGDAAHTVS